MEKKLRGYKILLGGDMHLPGIDWTKESVKKTVPFKRIHQHFLDVMHDHD